MLQSNEDKIRVFPAIPSAWDTTRIAFTLLARGAFIVSSERNERAQVTQIGIKSLKGNFCRVQNPWSNKKDIIIQQENNGKRVKFKLDSGNVISFTTKPDTEYIIKVNNRESIHDQIIYSGNPNNRVKLLGNRILGKLSGWNDSTQ